MTAPIQPTGTPKPNQLLTGQVVDSAAYTRLDGSSPGGNTLTYNPTYAQTLGYLISVPPQEAGDPAFNPLTYWPFDSEGTPTTGNALLVGEGSASGNEDSDGDGVPDGYVTAPLIPIESESEGAYSWWIADEGLKAQINLTDQVDYSAT